MRLPFTKCAISLTDYWSKKRCDDKMCNVTLPGGQKKRCDDCLSQNMQCHSQTVGHRKRYDKSDFHKMSNVTHKLLIIGNDVMRLTYTK